MVYLPNQAGCVVSSSQGFGPDGASLLGNPTGDTFAQAISGTEYHQGLLIAGRGLNNDLVGGLIHQEQGRRIGAQHLHHGLHDPIEQVAHLTSARERLRQRTEVAAQLLKLLLANLGVVEHSRDDVRHHVDQQLVLIGEIWLRMLGSSERCSPLSEHR